MKLQLHKISCAGIILLTTIVSLAGFARAAENVVEPVKYWLDHPYFYWIDDKAEDILSLQVYRGKDLIPAEEIIFNSYGGIPHARITLKEEKNRISIKKGRESVFEAEIFHAPSFMKLQVPKSYKPYFFHLPEKEKSCGVAGCHRMEAQESDKVPKPYTEGVCYKCHKEIVEGQKWVHGPAGAWTCLGCHSMEEQKVKDAGNKQVKYAIKEKMISALCFICHEKNEKTFAQYKYLHGPVGAGACTACHSPHGSAFRYQLRWEVNTVCVACHQQIKELLSKPVVHGIIKKKGCTACHSPHGTNSLRQLYNPIKELCFSCHPQIEKTIFSHGVQGHPIENRIDPRRRDDCEECEDCIACIKEKGPKGEPKTMADCPRQCSDCDNRCLFSCASCHNPHASDGKKLLTDDIREQVCTQCHKY